MATESFTFRELDDAQTRAADWFDSLSAEALVKMERETDLIDQEITENQQHIRRRIFHPYRNLNAIAIPAHSIEIDGEEVTFSAQTVGELEESGLSVPVMDLETIWNRPDVKIGENLAGWDDCKEDIRAIAYHAEIASKINTAAISVELELQDESTIEPVFMIADSPSNRYNYHLGASLRSMNLAASSASFPSSSFAITRG